MVRLLRIFLYTAPAVIAETASAAGSLRGNSVKWDGVSARQLQPDRLSEDPWMDNTNSYDTFLSYDMSYSYDWAVPGGDDMVPPLENGFCSNGVPGIESKGACCVYECGQCGGSGCSTIGLTLGLGAAECCEAAIVAANVPCGQAPCVVGGPIEVEEGQPLDDLSPVPATMVPPASTPPATVPSGDTNGPIEVEEGQPLDDFSPVPATTVPPTSTPPATVPSVDTSGSTCRDGTPGIESKGACCVAECGVCGGVGCASRAASLGLGASECCELTIKFADKPCGEAPCVVGEPMPAPSTESSVAKHKPVASPTPATPAAPLVEDPMPVYTPEYMPSPSARSPSMPTAEPTISTEERPSMQTPAVDDIMPVSSSEYMPPPSANSPSVPTAEPTTSTAEPPSEQTTEDVSEPMPVYTQEPVLLPSEELSYSYDYFVDDMIMAPSAQSSMYEGGVVSTCSNGFPGIESSGGACCVGACGVCGGPGCSTVALDMFLTAADCCESTILENALSCEEAGMAPCSLVASVEPAPTPMEMPMDTMPMEMPVETYPLEMPVEPSASEMPVEMPVQSTPEPIAPVPMTSGRATRKEVSNLPPPLAAVEAPVPEPVSSNRGNKYWVPKVGDRWQYNLASPVDTTVDADVFFIDMNAGKEVIDDLHAQGKAVVCYISFGTVESWRSDADDFPPEAVRNSKQGWVGENYLDINNPGVKPVMKRRIIAAAELGCDGIEPDNIDLFGFDYLDFTVTIEDQINYNKWFCDTVHEEGMLIGMKNSIELMDETASKYDFAINESCQLWNECDLYIDTFLALDKPVFQVKYGKDFSICDVANSLGMDTIIKNTDLKPPLCSCADSSRDFECGDVW